MEFQDYENFVNNNHRGVITTYRRNGAGHTSIVVCGAYKGKAAYVIVYGNSVKVRNLQNDKRCNRDGRQRRLAQLRQRPGHSGIDGLPQHRPRDHARRAA